MPSMHSRDSGYRSSSSLSPASIAGVIIVHAALGAAVLSMTAVTIFQKAPTVLWVENHPADPTPTTTTEPVRTPKATGSPAIGPRVTPTIFPKPDETYTRVDPPVFPPIDGQDSAILDPVRPIDPPPPVELVEARPDARFSGGFQPAYPAAMLRLQMEGNVTVRVTIGTDGRVTDVALVSSPDPAFFEATKRQALSRWRFIPATRDGVATISERVMTVRFRLTD